MASRQQQQQQHAPDGIESSSSNSGMFHEGMGLSELRTRARKHVDDAIKLIPMERKAAYLEALEKAPNLFEDESDPLKFLRRCSYNIWDASERLCLYWTLRKKAFEPDRAFLPLVLTGTGALDKNDILSLQAGFPAVLPSSRKLGKQVLYCDRRQHVPSLTAANRMRGIFYMAKFMAEDESAQTEGILVFVLMVTPKRIQEVDYDFVQQAFQFAIHAMPVKVQFHLLSCLPRGSSDRKLYTVQDIVSWYASTCLSSDGDVDAHFEREHNQLLEMLQHDFGLTKTGIPTELGGSWGFVQALSWCRKRALMEQQAYKTILADAARKQKKKPTAMATTATNTTSDDNNKRGRKRSAPDSSSPPSFSSSTGAGVQDNDNDDDAQLQAAKRRASNLIHSRRKRERRRQEISRMTEERDRLQHEHESLTRENARLQDLWERAQQELRTPTASSTTTADCGE